MLSVLCGVFISRKIDLLGNFSLAKIVCASFEVNACHALYGYACSELDEYS